MCCQSHAPMPSPESSPRTRIASMSRPPRSVGAHRLAQGAVVAKMGLPTALHFAETQQQLVGNARWRIMLCTRLVPPPHALALASMQRDLPGQQLCDSSARIRARVCHDFLAKPAWRPHLVQWGRAVSCPARHFLVVVSRLSCGRPPYTNQQCEGRSPAWVRPWVIPTVSPHSP